MSMVYILVAGTCIGSCGKFNYSKNIDLLVMWVAAAMLASVSTYIYLVGDLRNYWQWGWLAVVWWNYIMDTVFHFKRFWRKPKC